MDRGSARTGGAAARALLASLVATSMAIALGVALGAPTTALLVVGSAHAATGHGTGSHRAGAEVPRADASTWGPSQAEIDQARAEVSSWSLDRLAGQVIVGRYFGTDPEAAATLVSTYHLAGVCVTQENVVDTEQVLATTAAVARAVEEDRGVSPVIGADQEGGAVAHLDAVATHFPAFAVAGEALAADDRLGGHEGRDAVRDAAYATAMQVRSLGFTWVFAPDADVTIGSGDPTIGDRSPSGDPHLAARAVTAAVKGYEAAGLVSTLKHFPGHGDVTTDSHVAMPVQPASLDDLAQRDLLPFEAGVRAGAPVVMMSHIDVQAIAPGLPASLSAGMYAFLRQRLGFQGVVITDSLGMGAVAGQPAPAVQALQAGADLLLMPAITSAAHANIVRAVEDGELPLTRLQDAAARVVALGAWQQRVAATRPVPADVDDQADVASATLSATAAR